MNEQQLFVLANDLFGGLVATIRRSKWSIASPITPEWDVCHLVEHVVDDNRWVPDMLAGHSVGEFTVQHREMVAGENLERAWNESAGAANAAVKKSFESKMTVHLSYADVTASEYVGQMIIDRVIHAWDLAIATSQRYEADHQLIEAAYHLLGPQADEWRRAGIFGEAVALPEEASLLDRLLALSGRNPNHST